MNWTSPNSLLPESNTAKIFALVDCNNFYASCERIFNPYFKKIEKYIGDLMHVIDKINEGKGQSAIKFAVQETKKRWKMNQERLSPNYTTKWNEILKIKIKVKNSILFKNIV